MVSGSARPASLGSFGDREEAGHDGATPRVALHLDGAAVLLEDPVADGEPEPEALVFRGEERVEDPRTDRKSTRLNSSHRCISYAVFCLKKKIQQACTDPTLKT